MVQRLPRLTFQLCVCIYVSFFCTHVDLCVLRGGREHVAGLGVGGFLICTRRQRQREQRDLVAVQQMVRYGHVISATRWCDSRLADRWI